MGTGAETTEVLPGDFNISPPREVTTLISTASADAQRPPVEPPYPDFRQFYLQRGISDQARIGHLLDPRPQQFGGYGDTGATTDLTSLVKAFKTRLSVIQNEAGKPDSHFRTDPHRSGEILGPVGKKKDRPVASTNERVSRSGKKYTVSTLRFDWPEFGRTAIAKLTEDQSGKRAPQIRVDVYDKTVDWPMIGRLPNFLSWGGGRIDSYKIGGERHSDIGKKLSAVADSDSNAGHRLSQPPLKRAA